VFGKEGKKTPLFCVFVMQWDSVSQEVVGLCVRKQCGCHTAEYDEVMRVVGRPVGMCHCEDDTVK